MLHCTKVSLPNADLWAHIIAMQQILMQRQKPERWAWQAGLGTLGRLLVELKRRLGLSRVAGPVQRLARPARLFLGAPREGGAAAHRFALALQGGGAHGAFTWGVLDRLLAEPHLAIAGISGTSAGAFNAAALASGYLSGGPEGAQKSLAELWRRVARLAPFSPSRITPLERLVAGWNADWMPVHIVFDLASRLLSPYQLNPLGLDPVRNILVELIDFEGLKGPQAIPLFIAATNIHDGGRRIFTNAELSPDVLIASACLPTIHHAVKLDDGYYWDGGFSANPPLLPLIDHCDSSEILLVHVNPMNEPDIPVTARGIHSRLNTIVFNGPLKRELEMISWLQQAIERAGGKDSRLGRRLAQLKIRSIGADELMRRLGTASKLNPDWRFVTYLRDAGGEAAERWLEDAFGGGVEQPNAATPVTEGNVAPAGAPSSQDR